MQFLLWRNFTVIGVALVILCGILLLMQLLASAKKKPLVYQFASPIGKSITVTFNITLIIIACLLAWWALASIKYQIKEEMRESLQTVLKTTMEAMTIWSNDKKARLKSIAADPRIVNYVTAQVRRHERKEKLIDNSDLAGLRYLLSEDLQVIGQTGFHLIARDGTNIAASENSDIGESNLITQQKPELFRLALYGETILIPPIPVSTDEAGHARITATDQVPMLFFATPVFNTSKEVIAILTQRLDPHDDFSHITLLGRIGQTGETYVFDKQGRLLSKSRFLHHLVAAELIRPGEQSILSVDIRDPGVNLVEGLVPIKSRDQQKLTKMAASATSGESDFNIEGYRDYRGVPVIGAWLWDDNLAMGMASEIDVAEAMHSYYSARLAVIIILAITVSVSIIFTLFTIILGSRAYRALKTAHEQLELRVEQRTRELSEAKEQMELTLQELANSEKRYRSLVANIPGAVYRCDLDQNWTMRYLSDYVEQMTGYPAKDFIENKVRSYASIIHPEDVELVSAAVFEGVRSSGFYKIEYRIINRDEKVLWCFERGQVIRNNVGEVGHLDGFILDITERKEAEIQLQFALAKLERSEKWLDLVLQSARLGVWEYNVAKDQLQSTEATARILGYHPDQILEKSNAKWRLVKGGYRALSELRHSQDRQRYISAINALMANRSPAIREEYRLLQANGTWRWVQDVGRVVEKDDKGTPLIAYGILIDIDQMKRLQFELTQSKDKAESANKAKSMFLANMSHEIRTPMNAILGYAQLLKIDQSLDDEHHNIIEIINRSGKHLLDLINDILDMSKIEAGRMELVFEDFDLHELLDDIEAMLRVRTITKGLTLQFNDTHELPQYVYGDQGKLRQVLINLLGNGIKFTENGFVVLTNQVIAKQDEQVTIEFTISDSGIGIAKDKLDSIFEPFSQEEHAQQFGGTGLGLAISRQIIRLMGGDIQVESQFNQGSQFIMTVPIKIAMTKNAFPKPAVTKIIGLKEKSKAPMILVVDDNMTNRDLLRRLLCTFGFPIVEASGGQEAIEIFKKHQPPIILMDVVMYPMNGIETTKAIRNLPSGKSAVIVAVTASAMENEVDAITSEGANAVIRKPIQVDELLSTLADLTGLGLIVDEQAKSDQNARELSDESENMPTDLMNLPASLYKQIAAAIRTGKIAELRQFIAPLKAWNQQYGKVYEGLVNSYELKELKKFFLTETTDTTETTN